MWFALPETRSFRNVGGKFLTQSSLVVVKNTLGSKRGPEQGQPASQREHAHQAAEEQTQSLAAALQRIRSLEVLFKIPFKAIVYCL